MADAARDWLGSLDPEQRTIGTGAAPGDDETDAERRRWFCTPTDHGGLTMHRQRPAQQRGAMRLVASGLSTPGYVTVATTMGLENVLAQVEGFVTWFDRERGRDPGLYHLRVFGEPGGGQPWGWRFGGHHVSLNNLVVDGMLISTTPCFMGADPASSPLHGGALNRPLARVEDLARDLLCSLPPQLTARALLLPRAPSDFVTANRTHVAEGDRVIPLAGLWRDKRFPDRVSRRSCRRSATRSTRPPASRRGTIGPSNTRARPRACPAPSWTPSSARCCTLCSAPTSTASPPACPRRPATTRPPSTPCTSRGRAQLSLASPATTASRARGCSSSGTTRSAARPRPFGVPRPGRRLRL